MFLRFIGFVGFIEFFEFLGLYQLRFMNKVYSVKSKSPFIPLSERGIRDVFIAQDLNIYVKFLKTSDAKCRVKIEKCKMKGRRLPSQTLKKKWFCLLHFAFLILQFEVSPNLCCPRLVGLRRSFARISLPFLKGGREGFYLFQRTKASPWVYLPGTWQPATHVFHYLLTQETQKTP